MRYRVMGILFVLSGVFFLAGWQHGVLPRWAGVVVARAPLGMSRGLRGRPVAVLPVSDRCVATRPDADCTVGG